MANEYMRKEPPEAPVPIPPWDSRPIIPLDTLQRALHAVEVAKESVAATGADTYQSTFRQGDGTLGGQVVLTDKGWLVDFSVLGEMPRQVSDANS